MKKVYFDSNLYISVLVNDVYATSAIRLLERAENKQIQIISSVLVYGEVIKANSNSTLEFLDTIPVEYAELDRNIITSAAILRLKHVSLKLPDAIHLATAIENKCTHFVSEDKKLTAIAKVYLPSGSAGEL